MMKKTIVLTCCLLLALFSANAWAAISAAEAEKLGKDLTPLGAERAGNADGSIPEWTGGLTGLLPDWPNKDNYRPNPYADDKILFTITEQNMEQYADKLPEAAKAMLKAYPNAFKMNVYPSRRTAAFPQWYYDAIKSNSTTAKLINDGNGVEGVWGAIPFPIPKNGNEVIWNHLLRLQAIYRVAPVWENIVYVNGSRQDILGNNQVHHIYYDQSIPKEKAEGAIFKFNLTIVEPARDSGEGTLAVENINPVKYPRSAWTYDPGERRVRRAPNLAFDTPDRALNVVDDYDIFSGSPEKYDWKLLGKQEMYIPYNNNEVNSPRRDMKASTPAGFLDSEMLRYELHRVWVVEANLKQDKRHMYAKRVFYIDEDSWCILASDKYDGNGNLWRVSFGYPLVSPEFPVTGGGSYVHVDLKKNGYYLAGAPLGTKGWDLEQQPPEGNFFTPAALRRRGR